MTEQFYETGLVLLALVAAFYLIRSASRLHSSIQFSGIVPPGKEQGWRTGYCAFGLVVGLSGWLCSLGILIILAVQEDNLGPLIPYLLIFGILAAPFALVMGCVTKTPPGYLLAKAGTAQVLFWCWLWFFAGRGIL